MAVTSSWIEAPGPFWPGQWVVYGGRVWRVIIGDATRVHLCSLRTPRACPYVSHDHLAVATPWLLMWGKGYDPARNAIVPLPARADRRPDGGTHQ